MKTKLGYEIYFEEKGDFTFFNTKIREIYKGKKVFVITDSKVYKLHEKALHEIFKGYDLYIAKATKKDFNNYKRNIEFLFSNNIDKKDLLVSFGGGTIGDLTGLIASTIFRGINYIQIPTTLLSQIDSSIGGKTAIDTKYGKNLIGSFYNPNLVLISTIFQKTLSKRDYNNGLAEALKMGLLFDRKIIEEIASTKRISISTIKSVIKYKEKVVYSDPFDKGERKVLNFGHTFGHAIEKINNYKTYRHGEAISYGMLISLKLGMDFNITENKDIYDDLYNILVSLKLVDENIKLNHEDLLDQLRFDKKMTFLGLDFIFLINYENPIIKKVNIENGKFEII